MTRPGRLIDPDPDDDTGPTGGERTAAHGPGGPRVEVYHGAWVPEVSRGAAWVSEYDEPGALEECPECPEPGWVCRCCQGTGAIFMASAAVEDDGEEVAA